MPRTCQSERRWISWMSRRKPVRGASGLRRVILQDEPCADAIASRITRSGTGPVFASRIHGGGMAGTLEKQVAVVTGAGRGLGRAFAVALAHEDAHVILVARSRAELQETHELVRRAGGVAHLYAGDVTDWDATVKIMA